MTFNDSAVYDCLMTGALPFSEYLRAYAIRCHSATNGSACHFTALKTAVYLIALYAFTISATRASLVMPVTSLIAASKPSSAIFCCNSTLC